MTIKQRQRMAKNSMKRVTNINKKKESIYCRFNDIRQCKCVHSKTQIRKWRMPFRQVYRHFMRDDVVLTKRCAGLRKKQTKFLNKQIKINYFSSARNALKPKSKTRQHTYFKINGDHTVFRRRWGRVQEDMKDLSGV